MIRKDHLLSEEEHLENAKDLAMAVYYLKRLWARCDNHYPKTHPIMKQLDKFTMSATIFSTIKHLLEEESLKVGVIDKHGFIYYHLDELCKKEGLK